MKPKTPSTLISFVRVLCAWTILILATTLVHAQYFYTTLNVPEATNTYTTGISGTNIIGYYESINGEFGFLYNGSSYRTLSVPGAEETESRSISGENIVGEYWNSENPGSEGFLYNISSGVYTTFSVAGKDAYSDTDITGISGTNVVGYCQKTNTYFYGFLYNGSTLTTLSVPTGSGGVLSTFAQSISGNNIVGWTIQSQGFLYNISSSNYMTLSVPGAEETEAWGISSNNVVGIYDDGNGWKGFLYNINTGNYATVSVPGAEETEANVISGNNIVGYFVNSNEYDEGFLYNINSGKYITLSVPGAEQTWPEGVSGNNLVGSYEKSSGSYYNFVATPLLVLQATNIGGRLQLTVSGPSDSTIIQTSTNMVNWVSVYTNTTPFTFTDSTMAFFPDRFYRAMLSP